jgi:hypothetical protein
LAGVLAEDRHLVLGFRDAGVVGAVVVAAGEDLVRFGLD